MNTDKARLLEKIDCLPDHLLKQVLDFVKFLLWQQNSIRPPAPLTTNAPTPADQAWLDPDLSNLGAHEPYEWAESELEQGKPVKYIPGKGFIIIVQCTAKAPALWPLLSQLCSHPSDPTWHR